MKIGICVNLPAPDGEPKGPDTIALASELGYDYVELPLAPLAELDESGYRRVREKLGEASIKCETFNIFFPARVRLTGENRDEALVAEYIGRALERAGEVGAKIVVFGSSGAKNVPEGFLHEKAFWQIVETMKTAAAAAAKNGVRIAIEALNRKESNIILNLTDSERLMAAVDEPSVKMLFDYYHFAVESDSFELLSRLVKENHIIHTHFADPMRRAYPIEASPEFENVFNTLRGAGYDARCSLEAGLTNPAEPRAEMETALAVMRRLAG